MCHFITTMAARQTRNRFIAAIRCANVGPARWPDVPGARAGNMDGSRTAAASGAAAVTLTV